ncbi:oligopeptidase A [Candidatus Erwinia haradaeae]|uniref:oligopeptidase A n=1 Tax=Candidatus Erwinia haradaeae TaxID=1922217 RepID=A0A803GCF4_9GAMM|nr:oligopeptidase A [Candidatus Erwinia haradaeae]VFP87943.1 Oligopeptidase A [Candidatus Erwinia haradaeae]
MINPLLSSFRLPPFYKIKPEHMVPAITQKLNQCRLVINRIITQGEPYYWDNFVQPISEVTNELNCLFSLVSHLNSVKNSPILRLAYEKILILVEEYSTWVGQNQALYKAYCNIKNEVNIYTTLSFEQKKMIKNTLRDFKLSAIDLPRDIQYRYGQITIRLSILSSKYSNNVLDATLGWNKLIIDKNELSGIPESTILLAKKRAEDQGKNGWLLSLDDPSYRSILTYCDTQYLREEFYRVYFTRASDQGPNAGKWDNTEVMQEALTLRYELAELLGFSSYASQSLVTKMAQTPMEVSNFLNTLAERVRSSAKVELEKLSDFVKKIYGTDRLQPWDIAYYSEKYKQNLYHFNSEDLRAYFPEYRVLYGLFEIIHRVFGITSKERHNVEIYHKDVRFFDLFDDKNYYRGSFFLDLYSRDHKRSGAWMDECVTQMRKSDGSLQKPVAYLVCNFDRPLNGQPALFTHNEVITLFHEFGHALHHILTKIDIPLISGINGVPWDAIELPSQLMEKWCWHPESLKIISEHYKTLEPLPDDLIYKILEAKNYQAALSMLRQIEFSLFDFRLHEECYPGKDINILDIFQEVHSRISVFPLLEWNRFPHTFSHIFSGGYAAGYYSYLWAAVLASDCWSRFEKEGIFNRKTGESFLDNILTRGGSEDFMALFCRFRGRKPQIDPFLYQNGITIQNSQEAFY